MAEPHYLPNYKAKLPALEALVAQVRRSIEYGPRPPIKARIGGVLHAEGGVKLLFVVDGLHLSFELSDEHAKWLLVVLNEYHYRLFHSESDSGRPESLPENPKS